MTIYVARNENGTLKVRQGEKRLRAALAAFGFAHVTDVVTDEQIRAHVVDGQLVVLSDHGSRSPETNEGASR